MARKSSYELYKELADKNFAVYDEFGNKTYSRPIPTTEAEFNKEIKLFGDYLKEAGEDTRNLTKKFVSNLYDYSYKAGIQLKKAYKEEFGKTISTKQARLLVNEEGKTITELSKELRSYEARKQNRFFNLIAKINERLKQEGVSAKERAEFISSEIFGS